MCQFRIWPAILINTQKPHESQPMSSPKLIGVVTPIAPAHRPLT